MGSDKPSARARHGASDTAPEIERLMLEGYRQMSPAEKVRRVSDLNRAAVELAAEGIRLRHGPLPNGVFVAASNPLGAHLTGRANATLWARRVFARP